MRMLGLLSLITFWGSSIMDPSSLWNVNRRKKYWNGW